MNTTQLKEFPGLSAEAFQHPWDVQAVQNLQHVPLLGALIRTVSSSFFERQVRMMSISSMVRLGPNQGASVYRQFEKAAKILDLRDLPDIYISNQYTINAMAYGIEKYQIVLFSGLIDALSEEELLAVIGHELGHVKCDHMLYKTMAYIIRYFGIQTLIRLLPAGTGTLAALPLQMAILQWERMAEFSCDRAGLLVVQDEQVVASALAKLAGGSHKILPEINMDEVVTQADEYKESDRHIADMLFKVNMMLMQTHPFPIVRAKEIINWADTDQYQNILRGEYVVSAFTPSPGEPTAKVCPSCKRHNRVTAAACGACGTSLEKAHIVCTNCGIRVFGSWSTCAGCGSNLTVAQTNGEVMM